jgi:dihydroorotate dehydrogenase
VDNADAAWEKISHGATLVQIYSAMIYHGPAMIGRINRGLVKLIEKNGLRSIGEAVGRSL